MTYRPVTESIASARDDVAAWLADYGVGPGDCDRIVLAVSELVSNAVQASSEPIAVTTPEAKGRTIRIEVTNTAAPGSVPDRDEWGPEEVLAARGRGLAIVEAVADRVHVTEESGVVSAVAEFEVT